MGRRRVEAGEGTRRHIGKKGWAGWEKKLTSSTRKKTKTKKPKTKKPQPRNPAKSGTWTDTRAADQPPVACSDCGAMVRITVRIGCGSPPRWDEPRCVSCAMVARSGSLPNEVKP